jgi:hypothetical protein
LIADLDDNATYNHDHAIRSGTHVTGVRTCMARGKTLFSWSAADSGTQAVLFSNAEDGDPDFLTAPIVTLSLQESPSGDAWLNKGPVAVHIDGGTLDENGFTAQIDFFQGDTLDATGWVHWIAIGEIQVGE